MFSFHETLTLENIRINVNTHNHVGPKNEMPAKQKQAKYEWQMCIECEKLIYIKDTEKHVKECDNESEPTTSYISKSKLHTVIFKCRNNEDEKFSLPQAIKNNFVLVHPSTMRYSGLSIGHECILDDEYVCIAWPSSSITPTSVGVATSLISDLHKKDSDRITVEPVSGMLPMATEIYLKQCWNGVQSTDDTDSSLQDFVKNALVGRCYKVGNIVNISYYGQNYQFEVTDFKACQSQQDLLDQSNLTELSHDISAMNISDSSCDLYLKTCDKSLSSESFTESSPVASTPKTKSKGLELFCTPVAMKRCVSKTQHLFLCVNSGTDISFQSDQKEETNTVKDEVTLDTIGGLKSQIQILQEMIHLPLTEPELFRSFGIPPPRGVLIYGPSGTGKSLLLKAIINQVQAHVITVGSSDVISKYFGESELKLRNIFKEAEERAPSIIVMDDVDSLLLNRDKTQNDSQKRLVATMLTLMDGISQKSQETKTVMVVAACCVPDALDPALRRPGRFDKEIEVGVPTSKEREEILTKILQKTKHSLSNKDILETASKAHGFVGADLANVCQQASLNALKRSPKNGSNLTESICINRDDLSVAMTIVQPTGMREVQLEIPQVKWDDIGGQEEIKLKLKQAVEWPLLHPEAFQKMGITPPRGILMYGPPGCSKTMIAKALATESGLNFIAIKGPELFNKWVGESERAVREVFRKARAAAPSIVFFDEIDALAVERGSSGGSSNVGDRVLAQLLTEIDGVERLNDVTIVAATNRPDMIDKALMRPGRLDRILYVPLPDDKTRTSILEIQMRRMPVDDSVDINFLVEKTQGYSGAEICAVCHEAAMNALQEDISAKTISLKHFSDALTIVTPRIDSKLTEFYNEYQKKSGIKTI